MGDMKLTKAQERVLGEIRAKGAVRYYAQKAKLLDVLESRGLIEYTIEVRPDVLRGRHCLIYIATAKG